MAYFYLVMGGSGLGPPNMYCRGKYIKYLTESQNKNISDSWQTTKVSRLRVMLRISIVSSVAFILNFKFERGFFKIAKKC